MAGEAALGGVIPDPVMDPRPAHRRSMESHPEFDALDRLDTHKRMRQPAVELAVPLDVAAKPDWQTHGDDLDGTAERIARFFAFVYLGDNRAFGLGVGDPHLRLLGDAREFLDADVGGGLEVAVAPRGGGRHPPSMLARTRARKRRSSSVRRSVRHR